MKETWDVPIVGYYAATQHDEAMPRAAAWRTQSLLPSEGREGEISHDPSYVGSEKVLVQTRSLTDQEQTPRLGERSQGA